MSSFDQMDRLCGIIADRATADPKQSYVAKLALKGPLKVAKKLGEEAVEVAIAAAVKDRAQVVAESADLLFHLLVLWRVMDIAPEAVMEELKRREAKTGLEEKAARPED